MFWTFLLRRDSEHIGRRMLKIEGPSKRKTKEEINGGGERGRASSWCERRRCRENQGRCRMMFCCGVSKKNLGKAKRVRRVYISKNTF